MLNKKNEAIDKVFEEARKCYGVKTIRLRSAMFNIQFNLWEIVLDMRGGFMTKWWVWEDKGLMLCETYKDYKLLTKA